MYRILVVDDDEEITALLSQYLGRFGFEVHCAADGVGMHNQLKAHRIDLVVMDVMLPGVDGMTLARLLRQQSQIPIIMLTARAESYDCVVGLELGADDYVGKPFEPRELVARIHSVLRRHGHAQPNARQATNVRFDAWTLQRLERQVVDPQGMVVPLSYAEYRLLCTLLESPRRVFSREQLMEQARGRSMDSMDRSVDLLVSRLRHKLGEEGASLIKTVRGAGYMLDARQVQASAA
ncbi:MAG: response regulator transcription factor [Acidovorax sp.]|jgi:two-component system OmpR family response regulator|nr:response regulator transcription factor [Acidovorax sp.]